jgi:GNAT superfamily N-acetyltransferase
VSTALRVRPVAPGDLAAVQRLTDAEGWGYDADDLRRLAALSPDGFLVLEEGGDVRGCLTVLVHGSIAWIGSVVVDGAHRGRGLARALMEDALAFCERRRAPHVYLDAFPPAAGLYLRLGFVEETRTERWAATPDGSAASNAGVAPIPASGIEDLVRADAQVFGAPRTALWRAMLADFPGWCWWTQSASGPRAWMAVRAGGGSAEIGPWCGDDGEARGLFAHALSRLSGHEVELSSPVDNVAARRTLLDAGFRVVGDHVRMWRGAPVAWDRARTWAIGGLEKG